MIYVKKFLDIVYTDMASLQYELACEQQDVIFEQSFLNTLNTDMAFLLYEHSYVLLFYDQPYLLLRCIHVQYILHMYYKWYMFFVLK